MARFTSKTQKLTAIWSVWWSIDAMTQNVDGFGRLAAKK